MSRILLTLAPLAAGIATTVAFAGDPQSVEVFSAGSLRVAWGEIAAQAGPLLNIDVRPTFGGSGLLRERLEKGDAADLFTSADLGSPRKLEAQQRTTLPVVAFARNRMCIVSRRAAHVSADNLVDRMLAQKVRLKTSTPVADPAGDYAWAIFDRIDAQRPGAGAALKEKAQALMGMPYPTAAPGRSPIVALFETQQVDMSITYCSGMTNLATEAPDLASLPVPPQLDPHPVYGLAVLSTKQAALRLALFLLSEKGQAIIAHAGLVPITDPAPAHP